MKILGLDLGTNSIGWAVVDKENTKILDAGVRIFPEGVVKESIGKGDKEQSKNATRRDHRQMRRQFYRKRLRKIKLLEVLIDQNMCPLSIDELARWKYWDRIKKTEGREFPNTPEFVSWLKLNPYELREKALKDQLNLFELGRIFYHFIQRRGFLSNRKGKEDSTIFTKGKPDENILPINITKEEIGEDTLGKYLSSISYKNGVPYKTIIDKSGNEIRVRGRYTIRDMYIEEFEKIWQFQSRLLNIDSIIVKSKRVRELRGALSGKRNSRRINYLSDKYGKENVEIHSNEKGVLKVITIEEIPLKQYLAGKILETRNENGDTKIQFKSNESVLFWQRPLRSQKGLLSNCRFENNLPVIRENGEFLQNGNGEIQTRSKKPCPISHPEFEMFRAYQFINNIKYGKNNPLTKEQRDTVLELINRKDKNFDFKLIPEALMLTYETFNYEDKHKVAGNPTIKVLRPLFSKEIWEKHYEDIWHCFYFYDDNEMLFEKIKRDYGFNKNIDAVEKVKLKEGYGSVSVKAIRNILPFLEKGYQYDQAVILGGVKNAFGKERWKKFSKFHDEIEKDIISILKEDNKEGEAIEKIKEHLALPALSYGFEKDDPHFLHLYHHSQEVEKQEKLSFVVPEVENLRNPIVQQGLNETRRLVNSLIHKYQQEYGEHFHFDQIKVEMGRDLRNTKEGRQEMSFRIRENEANNDDARERLSEYGLQPSRENIQKYLMFKEIGDRAGNVQCPYTGKTVSVADLLGRENLIQIEHIIPFSVSLDDSFGNKTLCEANFNRDKSEKTPYQFYTENPDPKLWGVATWDAVEERAFKLLPYRKAKKFTAKTKFETSSFIERQLNDSRYIAKKAVELLSHICNDVKVMPGQLTAELRHLWGLNNILQPVQNLAGHSFDVDEESGIPYYIVSDKDGEVINLQRKQNKRPVTKPDEILATGYVKNEVFSSEFFNMTINTPELHDGKYWAKLNVSEPVLIVPKYVERPNSDYNHIVFKGRVDNGFFKNDTYGRIRTEVTDGTYWAKFRVMKTKFETPEKNKQPKASRNQVVLFGEVSEGMFKCYVYECEANLPEGKYWIVLDLSPDNIELIRSENPKPDALENQILINATINESGNLVADIDAEYQISTYMKTGKYYTILEILSINPELRKLNNEPPETQDDQNLSEGNIWVDKYTGEIKFDPKKNRDDHRHHAIDAITIALTEQGYLQRLSTYNAQRKAKQRQKLDSTEKFPEPWNGFDQDVRKVVSSILVSHKKNNKTLTKNRKGFSVRGQLHKENVFGKRQAPGHEKSFHRRTKITDLKNNKHIGKIVDDTLREIIKNHLRDQCKINVDNPKGYTIPNDAFLKDGLWQVFLPNKNGEKVPVKKVRIHETLGNTLQLKSNLNQFVNPRNNHHVLIYQDHDGNLKEDVVQFWTVVERKLQGEEIYQLPEDGDSIVTTLEINDMFLLGLSDEEYESQLNNQAFLSSCLFRVQKISHLYYSFRSHLASTLDKKEEEIYIQSFNAWENQNPIKVEIDVLGNMIAI